jgi:hypothetical protein
MTRIGKKAAGRLLDGVEHNGFPSFTGEADLGPKLLADGWGRGS